MKVCKVLSREVTLSEFILKGLLAVKEGSVRIDCMEARQKLVDQLQCGSDAGRDRGCLDQSGCNGGGEK